MKEIEKAKKELEVIKDSLYKLEDIVQKLENSLILVSGKNFSNTSAMGFFSTDEFFDINSDILLTTAKVDFVRTNLIIDNKEILSRGD